ncbi:MAG TPA: response regulator [Roseiflexaceae bacterium]|nr:response regulator [Roseiflexaceae bacterium]
MRALPPAARLYIITIWAIAAALVCGALILYLPSIANLLHLLIWLPVYVLADYFEVEFEINPGEHVNMTVYEAVYVFLVAVGGPAAVVVVVTGTLITDTLHRRPWYRSLFNAAERAITYFGMYFVYSLFAQPDTAPFAGWQGVVALIATGGTYYILNTTIVATVLALVSHLSPIKVYLSAYSTTSWVHSLTIPLGAILAALWYVDPWLMLPGIALLITAHRSFRALAAWQEQNRRNRELAEESQRLAHQLEQLQAITTAMMTTLKPAVLIATIRERLAELRGASTSWVVLFDNHNAEVVARSDEIPAWAETPLDYIESLRLSETRQVHITEVIPATAQANSAGETMTIIPLALDNRTLGCICLAFDQDHPLTDADRRVLGAFGTQAALVIDQARLYEALEQKQAELLRSSKLAALGTFAAGIAHEFNNLLAGILGYAQLGQASNNLETQREMLSVIEQSCLRARKITSGLLTFARRSEPQRAMANVTDAIEGALLLIEPELRKAQISVVRQIDDVPPTICDIGQLTQVVLNLLTNARDAMHSYGSGTITISVRQVTQQIELSVGDTGVGIPAAMLDQVFQPFMTTKGALGGSETPGTGLGLAISYGIIESHNGHINISSKEGQGTTVTIQLPIIGAEQTSAEPAPQSTEIPAFLRILVVDDDAHVAQSMSQLLSHHGHQVQHVPSGIAALRAYRESTFDLVISDVVMPGMDGLALLRRLRQIDPHCQMLVMTGQPGDQRVIDLLNEGAIGLIEKPFTLDELLLAIAESERLIIAREVAQ